MDNPLRGEKFVADAVGANPLPPNISFSLHFLDVAAKRIGQQLRHCHQKPLRVPTGNKAEKLIHYRINV